MRKIRIGNDIRLKLKIKPNMAAGFDKIDELDLSSIKQLKCYLINTSWNRPPDPDKPAPFKRVGFPEFYMPQHHNIHNSGFPSYNIAPANLHNYDRFEPDFHDFHWWPGYRGFGLHPEHFHGDCCHHVHHRNPHLHDPFFFAPYDYRPGFMCGPHPHHFYGGPDHKPFGMEPHPFDTPEPGFLRCDEPYHPDFVPVDIFGRPAEDHSHQNPWAPWYIADSWVLHEANAVSCFFPAVQQRLCGVYKLVIVLTVFELGWGRHNLRTYTIDKGDIFELVDDESGESGNIFVDVDDTGEREDMIDSIYTERDTYIMASDTQLPVGGMDIEGNDYNIYVKLKDGTITLYNPKDWHFNELFFKSADESIVKVGTDGTLYAQDVIDATETTVRVSNKDNLDTFCEFTVIVKPLDVLIMGFDAIADASLMSPDKETLHEYSIKNKTYRVNNPTDGQYLWVFSQRKIHYIKAIDEDIEKPAELSSGFRVPMATYPKPVQGYFCYRSAAPILKDDMRIKIKFEYENN